MPAQSAAPAAPHAAPITTANITTTAAATVATERDALTKLEQALQTDMAPKFTAAVATLLNATGRIIVTGMGKSGHIARKIAATMASTGTPAHFVHPAEASHGDLGMMTKGDVVIAISNSGETAELADSIAHCKRFGLPLIAITSKPLSTLAKAADMPLVLPAAAEACPMGLAPTTSTTLTLALGDALAVALLAARGFTASNFRELHPGGKLGKLLLKVDDLMHTGAALPMVASGTSLQQALLEMSNKRLGCVGVMDNAGKLLGMLTDGDLRRAYSTANSNMNIFTAAVDDFMTKNPMTIPSGTLAMQAVALMNDKQITNIFIMQDDKAVGALHLHDCLRAGLA